MKTTKAMSKILPTLCVAALVQTSNAQKVDDQLQVARSALEADRKATVAGTMQFTEAEGKAFWPIYEQYRAEMDKSADTLLRLIKEYGQLYPNVPDDRAKVMLKELGDLEAQRVETKNSYLKKIESAVSPAKALRFAQVERRLDLATQLALASQIPLVPIEGRLTGKADIVATTEKGVPGGTVVQTRVLDTTVAAIDKTKRSLTLVDAAGIKTTVKVGPEVTRFDEIKVGDKLKVTAMEELVVFVAGAGDTSTGGSAEMVALAPKGAKPGIVMAETTQVTAKVKALDLEHHKATLEFEDGTTRVVAVREDVDLTKQKVGDKVVIRTTGSLAIQVTKR